MRERTPLMMAYRGQRVPHAVLEVNQCCNLSCLACYKRKSSASKTLEHTRGEVDQLLALRRLTAITIAGGEPTLHPQLPEIIAHCAGRGLLVQLISNGYGLTDELLDRCREAGLRDIVLHVDSRQGRPDAPPGATERGLDPLRDDLVRQVTGRGIGCSLALTLYRSTLPDLPATIERAIADPRVKRLVVFCCGDIAGGLRRFAGGEVLGTPYPGADRRTAGGGTEAGPDGLAAEEVGIAEAEPLLAGLGIAPYLYVASSRSAAERRWVICYSLALHGRGGVEQVLHLRPPPTRLTSRVVSLAQRLGLRSRFGRHLRERDCIVLALLHALGCGDLREAGRALRLCARRLRPGTRLAGTALTFQQPAAVAADGRLVSCRECPDATLRNGVLVPVCLADHLAGPDLPPGPATGWRSSRRRTCRP